MANSLVKIVGDVLELDGIHESIKYVGVVDAGSTGTRINVFGFLMPGTIIKDFITVKDEPGLHTMSSNQIAKSFDNLLQRTNGELKMRGINIKSVPLVFAGTAGIRSLSENKKKKLFKTIKKTLEENDIQYQAVDTISDYLEGLYALESIDFLKDYNNNVLYNYGCYSSTLRPILDRIKASFCDAKINSKNEKYTGIIEMGGGSIQIAYEFSKDDKYSDPFHVIETNTNKIYLNAFPGWGLIDGLSVLDKNKDYIIKNGNKKLVMYDELLKDFKSDDKPNINNVDEIFLLAYFHDRYSKLGCNYETNIEEILDKFDKQCPDLSTKFCKEIDYMTTFLITQDIKKNKSLYLVKDIAGINTTWALSRAIMML
ncbi:hypothetical protein COBT_000050 [Conglomerata obtusa]